MELHVLIVLSLIAVTMAVQGAEGVSYEAINNATNTRGGARFTRVMGIEHSQQVLRKASSFIWKIFRQSSAKERNNVESVLLIVESMDGVAYTLDRHVCLSADYVAGYQGNVRTEIEGILFHEVTHVWQWQGNGKAPTGLMEGIADFVRMKAGYAPAHWVKPGEGGSWDQGYDVTARFLDYCNGLGDRKFVADLNRRMRSGYSENLFKQLLGKTVGELWSDYKAAHGKNI